MALRVDGLSYRLIAPQLGHEPRICHGHVRSDGVVAMRLLLLALLYPTQLATAAAITVVPLPRPRCQLLYWPVADDINSVPYQDQLGSQRPSSSSAAVGDTMRNHNLISD